MVSNYFRYDINALRALAVLGVMIYHFDSSLLPGGFVGVDVFFVISGYLMGKIIIQRIESDSFSLLEFYSSRARRILPALLLLSLSLAVYGVFFLDYSNFKYLLQVIKQSLLFISNYTYAENGGYFQSYHDDNWLLHTWSLSVEWQFYLIFPAFLLAFNYFGFKNYRKNLTCLFVFSLGVLIFLPGSDNGADYYSFALRTWELLLGTVAFLSTFKFVDKFNAQFNILGLSLIACSFLFISNDIAWPGIYTFLPTIGTFLVIITRKNDWFIYKNSIVNYIGKWSYSIYLWHWPIYLFFTDIKNVFLLVLLSILMGFSSYHLVEKKTKNVFAIFLVWLVFITLSFNIKVFVGHFDSEYSNAIDRYAKVMAKKSSIPELKAVYENECNFYSIDENRVKSKIPNLCLSGNGGVLLVGDSHAQSLSYGLERYFQIRGVRFNTLATSGCSFGLGYKLDEEVYNEACKKSLAHVYENLKSLNPKLILVAQMKSHEKNSYDHFQNFIAANDLRTKLVVIGPVPQWTSTLLQFSEFEFKNDIKVVRSTRDDLFFTDSIMKDGEYPYISILEKLCDFEKNCLAYLDERVPLVWDYGHLTLEGSKFIADDIIGKAIYDLYFQD